MENNTNVTLTKEKVTSSSPWSKFCAKLCSIKSAIAFAIAATINQCLCVPTYAGIDIQPITMKSNIDVDTTAGMIMGLILKATSFIGGALAIWGLVMFGLAIKNDEPDSKQKALMTVFAGIVVLGLRGIVEFIFT